MSDSEVKAAIDAAVIPMDAFAPPPTLSDNAKVVKLLLDLGAKPNLQTKVRSPHASPILYIPVKVIILPGGRYSSDTCLPSRQVRASQATDKLSQ